MIFLYILEHFNALISCRIQKKKKENLQEIIVQDIIYKKHEDIMYKRYSFR